MARTRLTDEAKRLKKSQRNHKEYLARKARRASQADSGGFRPVQALAVRPVSGVFQAYSGVFQAYSGVFQASFRPIQAYSGVSVRLLNDGSELNLSTLSTNSKPLSITTPQKSNKVARDETEFQAFWAIWPRKVSRPRAWEAYWRAREGVQTRNGPPREPVSHERILSGAIAAKANYEARVKGDGLEKAVKYTPHPATWLNDCNWEQYPFVDPAEAAETDRVRRSEGDLSMQRSWVTKYVKSGGTHWAPENKPRDQWLEPYFHLFCPRPGQPGCTIPQTLLDEFADGLATVRELEAEREALRAERRAAVT